MFRAILLTLLGACCACSADDRGTITFAWSLEEQGAPFSCAPGSVVRAMAYDGGDFVRGRTPCELGEGWLSVPPGTWKVGLEYSEHPPADDPIVDPIIGGSAEDLPYLKDVFQRGNYLPGPPQSATVTTTVEGGRVSDLGALPIVAPRVGRIHLRWSLDVGAAQAGQCRDGWLVGPSLVPSDTAPCSAGEMWLTARPGTHAGISVVLYESEGLAVAGDEVTVEVAPESDVEGEPLLFALGAASLSWSPGSCNGETVRIMAMSRGTSGYVDEFLCAAGAATTAAIPPRFYRFVVDVLDAHGEPVASSPAIDRETFIEAGITASLGTFAIRQ